MSLYDEDRDVRILQYALEFYDDSSRDEVPLAEYRAAMPLPSVALGEWVHAIDAPGAKPNVYWKVVHVEHSLGLIAGKLIWQARVRVRVCDYVPPTDG